MTFLRIAVPSLFLVVLGACSGSIDAIVDSDGGLADDAESASDSRADGAARLDAGHQDAGHADGGNPDGGNADGGNADGGSSDAGSGTDAFPGTDGGTCNALVNGASQVTPIQVASTASPATGGPVTDGTYFLTGITIYTGVGGATGPVGSAEALTLQIAGTTAQSVAQSGGGAVTRQTATLTPTTLTTLTATTTCPSPQPPSTVSYSAGPTTFSVQLAAGTSTVVESFVKQ